MKQIIIVVLLGLLNLNVVAFNKVINEELLGNWIVVEWQKGPVNDKYITYGTLEEKGVLDVYSFDKTGMGKVYSKHWKNKLEYKWSINKSKLLLEFVSSKKVRKEYVIERESSNKIKLVSLNNFGGEENEVFTLKQLNSIADDDESFTYADSFPEYKNGSAELIKSIFSKISKQTREKETFTSVLVKLTIEKDGKISNVQVNDSNLTAGELSVIKEAFLSTKDLWSSGVLNSHKVRMINNVLLFKNTISFRGRNRKYKIVRCTKEMEVSLNENSIYTDVDKEGYFIGGETALFGHVGNNFKMPKSAQELGISGIIFIQFIVEKDGTISNIKAIAPKERQLGYGLEAECIRVLKLTSGKWIPAQREGKNVRSYWRFPFEIDNTNFVPKKNKRKKRR